MTIDKCIKCGEIAEGGSAEIFLVYVIESDISWDRALQATKITSTHHIDGSHYYHVCDKCVNPMIPVIKKMSEHEFEHWRIRKIKKYYLIAFLACLSTILLWLMRKPFINLYKDDAMILLWVILIILSILYFFTGFVAAIDYSKRSYNNPYPNPDSFRDEFALDGLYEKFKKEYNKEDIYYNKGFQLNIPGRMYLTRWQFEKFQKELK